MNRSCSSCSCPKNRGLPTKICGYLNKITNLSVGSAQAGSEKSKQLDIEFIANLRKNIKTGNSSPWKLLGDEHESLSKHDLYINGIDNSWQIDDILSAIINA